LNPNNDSKGKINANAGSMDIVETRNREKETHFEELRR
jgi:hypothetical protein